MNKLETIQLYHQLIETEKVKIPETVLRVKALKKVEDLAEAYYQLQDFEVYRSRVVNGYRSMGVALYWTEFANKLSPRDAKLLVYLRDRDDFETLAWAVKDKNGTPDFLLLRDKEMQFVEVKSNNETVKTSTVEFFIKYGHLWPISILRIVKECT